MRGSEAARVVPHWVPAAALTRGEEVEMVHYGGGVAVDVTGKVLWELAGTASSATYFRSAVKLWQALPMVKSGKCTGVPCGRYESGIVRA